MGGDLHCLSSRDALLTTHDMMQQIIVYLIVGGALLYLLWHIWRRFSSPGANCDCGSCPKDCPMRKKDSKH